MTEAKSYEQVLNENGSLLWKTVGISMQPLIVENRDFVYIKKRPDERLKKYDVVLFRRPGVSGRGKYVLHRILKVNSDGTYWIVGDNCIGGETVKDEDILGVLSDVKRNGKTVSVSDLGYKIYTYLWCAPWPVRFFILRYKSIPRRALRKIMRILHIQRKK